MAEYDLRSDVMRQKLSRDLFRTTIDALVEGAAHLRGMEWEAVVLVTFPFACLTRICSKFIHPPINVFVVVGGPRLAMPVVYLRHTRSYSGIL